MSSRRAPKVAPPTSTSSPDADRIALIVAVLQLDASAVKTKLATWNTSVDFVIGQQDLTKAHDQGVGKRSLATKANEAARDFGLGVPSQLSLEMPPGAKSVDLLWVALAELRRRLTMGSETADLFWAFHTELVILSLGTLAAARAAVLKADAVNARKIAVLLLRRGASISPLSAALLVRIGDQRVAKEAVASLSARTAAAAAPAGALSNVEALFTELVELDAWDKQSDAKLTTLGMAAYLGKHDLVRVFVAAAAGTQWLSTRLAAAAAGPQFAPPLTLKKSASATKRAAKLNAAQIAIVGAFDARRYDSSAQRRAVDTLKVLIGAGLAVQKLSATSDTTPYSLLISAATHARDQIVKFLVANDKTELAFTLKGAKGAVSALSAATRSHKRASAARDRAWQKSARRTLKILVAQFERNKLTGPEYGFADAKAKIGAPIGCDWCGEPDAATYQCGACADQYYCSARCQRDDWLHGEHHKHCSSSPTAAGAAFFGAE